MELRQYWRVLVRRGAVVRNTFLLVALLALLSVAYSYYTARYTGRTVVGVQVQPNPIRNSVVDPQQAAYANTDQVVNDLVYYGTNTIYFEDISRELAHRYGIHLDWKTIGQSLVIQPATSGHGIYIAWKAATAKEATAVVAAAADQLRGWVPVYHATLQRHAPPIATTITDPANARRIGLSTPLADFVLRAALGLVAGIILAYLFEYLDDTVQDEADVQHWLGLPTLAVIPARRRIRLRSA